MHDQYTNSNLSPALIFGEPYCIQELRDFLLRNDYFAFWKLMMIPTVIAITGGSGSGKTSMIRAIRSEFSAMEICIISQDDYYRARDDQLADELGYINFDLPSALDLAAFECDLESVIKGETVYRKRYPFNKTAGINQTQVIRPAPIILLEGLFLGLSEPVQHLIDFTVYMHAKDNLKLIRRIYRDMAERDYRLEEILHRYEHHVMPSYVKYVSQWRENADLVINNNASFEKGLKFIFAFLRAEIDQKSSAGLGPG